MREYLGYEPVKDELKIDFEGLRKEPILINYLEKDGTPVMHGMGFISEWKISSKTVRFRIPSFLEDVMKGLDEPKAIFQLLNWQIFNHFSGKYEAIIYKLCRDYSGVKRTPYMTLQEFRDYIGIKPKEYSEFMRLNQFVISGSCKKINQSDVSDIKVYPEFKREGRKVL
ncbi:MAG: replication initiation protein [Candidatus Competibacteraceae bacterium]|nr:replication initiation protein [Candidatus Competibacteraceae bacterium]